MPFPPDYKEKSREQILASARSLFNQFGYAEVSIDQIMSGAGFTRGGFYNHFSSKEELLAATLDDFARNRERDAQRQGVRDPAVARQVLKAYVCREHQDDFTRQCPLIALPSDVARSGPEVKRVYERVLRALVAVFEDNSEGHPGLSRRQNSLAMAASCVGAMVLSRTVEDDEFAEEIREAVLALADQALL